MRSDQLANDQAQLASKQSQLDDDRKKVDADRQAAAEERRRLEAERKALTEASSGYTKRLLALNEKEAKLQDREDRLSARTYQEKAEQIFLSELRDGRHSVEGHGDTLQLATPDGLKPLLIAGRPVSATFEKACRAIIELQAENRAADEFLSSLRGVAAELKAMQPEFSARVRAQEGTLAGLEMRRRSQARAAAITDVSQ